MKKIVKGNDFTLRIPVKKIVEGEAVPFPLPACKDIVVNLVNAYRRTALPYSISAAEDHVLEVRVESAAFALGAYALEVKGTLLGAAWRSNEYEQLVLVDNNAAADTELDGSDEGEGSVEMDTAIAVMPPTAELGQLIDEAHAAVKTAGEAADTLTATDKAVKEAESLRATAERGRVSAERGRTDAETLRVEAEKKRVEEADKAVAKVEQVVEAAKENVVYIQTTENGVEVNVDKKSVSIPTNILFRIRGFSEFSFIKNTTAKHFLLFWINYDVPSTLNLERYFRGLSIDGVLSLDLSGFNTSHVTNMRALFYDSPFTDFSSISGWDTSNVKDMSYMFYSCGGFLDTSDISRWNMGNVENMFHMFYACSFTSFYSKWDMSNVKDMGGMFGKCYELRSLFLSECDMSNVENMGSMFYECTSLFDTDVSSWDTSNVKNMSYMFYSCTGFFSLQLSGWNTSNVVYVSGMFQKCDNLRVLYVYEWDTSNINNMYGMFSLCSTLPELDLYEWDTGSVISMGYMFQGCASLVTLSIFRKNTSRVRSMERMFYQCRSLTELDLSEWDLSSAEDMSYMFRECPSLKTIRLGEGFGKMKDTVGTVNFKDCFAWTNDSVQTLLTLYDRKANGMGVITIMLHSNTKAVLGEDGIAALTAKGYTIA